MFVFENDLQDLVNNISFHKRKKKNHLQRHHDYVVKDINKSENMFVKSDKTVNFYKVTAKDYNTIIRKRI